MFYPGQKVVAIMGGVCRHFGTTPLVKGAIYTVHRCEEWRGRIGVELVEIGAPHYTNMYHIRAFRPAVERKTDISIFTKMLNLETV